MSEVTRQLGPNLCMNLPCEAMTAALLQQHRNIRQCRRLIKRATSLMRSTVVKPKNVLGLLCWSVFICSNFELLFCIFVQ